MAGKFRTIRTVTVTGTHIISLYRSLKRARDTATCIDEWEEAAMLLERFEKQTKIPVPPDNKEKKA